MITLQGRSTVERWRAPATDVWQVAHPQGPELSAKAVVIDGRSPIEEGAGLYLSVDPDVVGPGPTVHLPEALRHVSAGDVLIVAEDGSRVGVAWKSTATHNSILLTERCDHYCLMCSQPPKDRDDSRLFGRARRIIDALPDSAAALSLTGGEPTIDPELFLGLMEHIARVRPRLSTHVLSNGRRFSDMNFVRRYVVVIPADTMVGIPLYSADPSTHDFIVQSSGAFDETVKGIVNLATAGADVELRVVVQKANVDQLDELAIFIARNLPFVSQVALMGLEMTGLARPNASLVWVDPHDYREELRTGYRLLRAAGVRTRIYNHPLCLLDQSLWPAAVQSISDWKNDFPAVCDPCSVKESCSGVFSTSGLRLSPHIGPVGV